MKKLAFIYPGQGSQSVGMGQELYEKFDEVKTIFEQANNRLGYELSSIMFQGPEEKLTQTENAQPALLLVSTAITELLKKQDIRPVLTTGHSLGEYSALVAAEAIDYKDALELVHIRGRLMESAFPAGQGAMAAVLGLEKEELENTLETIRSEHNEVIEIANLNCPGQIVISGTKAAVDLSVHALKEAGAKRVLPLSVSGPFHSSLMKPAAADFHNEVEKIAWKNTTIPVFANVTADKVTDHQEIQQLLVEQLYSPVRFEEIIEQLLQEEVDAIVEIGNGKVLTGLVKKVNRRAKVFTVQDVPSLQELIDWVKEEE
ncbi:ACP S-malonyltransferase [Gracilibacillus dipsosauri]|uniref:ACP S-malonyltransferase n=1 Tax=Gracilibacillus dipsosauri TaxID=178340 RepID=UPI002409CE7F